MRIVRVLLRRSQLRKMDLQTQRTTFGWLITVVLTQHGKVLLADLHGQSHRPATDLGYLLTTDDLQLSDEHLDADPALANKCSLGSLASTPGSANGRSPSLSQLVRGPHSLGALISARWDGAPCLPSPPCPRPQPGETYFWGAYTCAAHSRGIGWAAGAATDEDRTVGASPDAALRRGAAVQIEVHAAPCGRECERRT